MPGASAMVPARDYIFPLNQVTIATRKMDPEIHVLDDVVFDHVTAAACGYAGRLFGNLPAAVSDDEAAEQDAVAPDVHDTPRSLTIEHRLPFADNDKRASDHDPPRIHAFLHEDRGAARHRIETLLKIRLGVGGLGGEHKHPRPSRFRNRAWGKVDGASRSWTCDHTSAERQDKRRRDHAGDTPGN